MLRNTIPKKDRSPAALTTLSCFAEFDEKRPPAKDLGVVEPTPTNRARAQAGPQTRFSPIPFETERTRLI
jgi:hypothetical protein